VAEFWNPTRYSRVPEVGPGSGGWLIRRPGSAHCVSGGGGRRRSRAPAARPCAGWRSSSPLRSGGVGITGTGAVRGRTRRPTSPAAACGRDQQRRGQGSPWLPYPVWAGGPGVHLGWDDAGALLSPRWRNSRGGHQCTAQPRGNGSYLGRTEPHRGPRSRQRPRPTRSPSRPDPPPPAVPQTRNLGYGSPTSSTSTLPSSTATTASPSGSAAARSPADRYGSVTHQVEPADPQGPARRWPGQVMLSGHDGVVIHADVVDRDAGDAPVGDRGS
jgi:hypothetical protein